MKRELNEKFEVEEKRIPQDDWERLSMYLNGAAYYKSTGGIVELKKNPLSNDICYKVHKKLSEVPLEH